MIYFYGVFSIHFFRFVLFFFTDTISLCNWYLFGFVRAKEIATKKEIQHLQRQTSERKTIHNIPKLETLYVARCECNSEMIDIKANCAVNLFMNSIYFSIQCGQKCPIK